MVLQRPSRDRPERRLITRSPSPDGEPSMWSSMRVESNMASGNPGVRGDSRRSKPQVQNMTRARFQEIFLLQDGQVLWRAMP
jgi:hypothetical protein